MSAVTKKEDKGVSFMQNYTPEQVDLIKNTVCKGSTDDELKLFLYTCNRTGLDPLMKQIYAIKRKSGQTYTMTIQTSIDGLRNIADRSGRYAPGSPTIFEYRPDKRLLSATAFVKKMTQDGTWHEISATAFFDEYAQSFGNELGKFWKSMPHVMIGKCAEALALRKAFPFELSGLYTHEEMNNPINAKTEEITIDEPIDDANPFKEDLVEIELREGDSIQELDEYLKYLCSCYKGKTIPQLKQMALEDLERFWKFYDKWRQQKS